MHETLLDPATGAFRGSQDADPTYAHRTTLAARRESGAPPCDPTLFANWNAIAASALLEASVVLDRPDCRESGMRVIRFLLEDLYDERAGVHHYFDGARRLPGMLTDQAYVLRALIDAAQYAGRIDLLDAATRLATRTEETLRAESGGFWDCRLDPSARGPMRRRSRSLLENSVFAEALIRLAQLTRNEHWREVAGRTLAVFANDYKSQGHLAASYARAVDLWLNPPVHVTIVGDAHSEDTAALRRAALTPYVASRLVQTLDPVRDAAWLERLGLVAPADGVARAYVSRGRESYAETTSAARLPALMTRIEPAS